MHALDEWRNTARGWAAGVLAELRTAESAAPVVHAGNHATEAGAAATESTSKEAGRVPRGDTTQMHERPGTSGEPAGPSSPEASPSNRGDSPHASAVTGISTVVETAENVAETSLQCAIEIACSKHRTDKFHELHACGRGGDSLHRTVSPGVVKKYSWQDVANTVWTSSDVVNMTSESNLDQSVPVDTDADSVDATTASSKTPHEATHGVHACEEEKGVGTGSIVAFLRSRNVLPPKAGGHDSSNSCESTTELALQVRGSSSGSETESSERGSDRERVRINSLGLRSSNGTSVSGYGALSVRSAGSAPSSSHGGSLPASCSSTVTVNATNSGVAAAGQCGAGTASSSGNVATSGVGNDGSVATSVWPPLRSRESAARSAARCNGVLLSNGKVWRDPNVRIMPGGYGCGAGLRPGPLSFNASSPDQAAAADEQDSSSQGRRNCGAVMHATDVCAAREERIDLQSQQQLSIVQGVTLQGAGAGYMMHDNGESCFRAGPGYPSMHDHKHSSLQAEFAASLANARVNVNEIAKENAALAARMRSPEYIELGMPPECAVTGSLQLPADENANVNTNVNGLLDADSESDSDSDEEINDSGEVGPLFTYFYKVILLDSDFEHVLPGSTCMGVMKERGGLRGMHRDVLQTSSRALCFRNV